jgi:rSAM/selenodomain-associated transferase 1
MGSKLVFSGYIGLMFMDESKRLGERPMDALIIFVKNPVPSQVKTRLARSIGNQQAADVYTYLLAHTRRVTSGLKEVQCLVYYADAVNGSDLWEGANYEKRTQQGANLGERMAGAIVEAIERGFSKVVIIGSDCLEIGEEHIRQAFRHLDEVDLVIGPASDGGYYLLGMKMLHPNLFEGIAWSSDEVLKATLTKSKAQGLSHRLLEVLSDVDDLEDYLKIKHKLSNG